MRVEGPTYRWVQMIRAVQEFDVAARNLARLEQGIQPYPDVVLDKDEVAKFVIATPTIMPDFRAKRWFITIDHKFVKKCLVREQPNNVARGERERVEEELRATGQEAKELGGGKKLRTANKWRGKMHNTSFTTNGYEAHLLRAHVWILGTLTVFEATNAQVRNILAGNIPPNYVRDKIQAWDKQSDDPDRREQCMFWDLAGHRARHLMGQSALTKQMTQFWAQNPTLKAYMDGRPTLKTHQLGDILAAATYISSRLHGVMQRVLSLFVAKMQFRKKNRERSFWDLLVARLIKPMDDTTRPPLIMFGNAGANNLRGCTMPVK
ncbi:hypothetical protein GGF32_006120 [Allomyces javanicus]|nr:hypothetical protein GGF32_006120 [Allomyces javanicus]